MVSKKGEKKPQQNTKKREKIFKKETTGILHLLN